MSKKISAIAYNSLYLTWVTITEAVEIYYQSHKTKNYS